MYAAVAPEARYVGWGLQNQRTADMKTPRAPVQGIDLGNQAPTRSPFPRGEFSRAEGSSAGTDGSSAFLGGSGPWVRGEPCRVLLLGRGLEELPGAGCVADGGARPSGAAVLQPGA